ncbi:hypothetical protein SETIT_2G009200v2 [Setaria italica]|uniref:F-box domain-containing protein n=2 Tax=Setaria italica TaxID=4555 RepID=A0A368PU77_SETIT|nr:hypothetical protein SETIT_2G009200v2 [Setaria italica]
MDAPPCRPTPPSPRALPHLPDGIVEDILLRVPADEPAGLLRSALTCKRWARLMADRGFRRRYRERHRPAPMLGFLANLVRTDGVARFFPTAGFRTPRADRDGYRAHDARHGRVLLNRVPGTDLPTGHQDSASALIVWDPITDEQRHLPLLQLRRREVRNWNAAVLCAGTAGGGDDACDHLDCGAGPFRVVFIGMNAKEIFAHVYSSESGAWSQPASGELLIPGEPQEDDPIDEAVPGVLAGNALHFVFLQDTHILKFDLATESLSVIPLPHRLYSWCMVLMAMDDGGRLGFAEVDNLNTLTLWAMELGPDGNVGGWARRRVIELSTRLPPRALRNSPDVVAFADAVDVVFLETTDGLYSFDLKFRKGTKVMGHRFYDVVPYTSFYTPVLRQALATTGEGSANDAAATIVFPLTTHHSHPP